MAEPRITQQAYHVSAGSNLPVHRVVIHTTEMGAGFPDPSKSGNAEAVARYFTSSSSGGSAHYVVDVAHEEHCVHDKAIAWHAPPNQGSIGIEICARAAYSKDQWLSKDLAPLFQRAAYRAAELCHRFRIPIKRLSAADLRAGKRGICGHIDVSEAWHQSDHSDPGSHFPWLHFINLVQDQYDTHFNTPDSPPPVHHEPTPRNQIPAWPGRVLGLGLHGSDVHLWQAEMAHRGWKIDVDGQYGPQSVAVCRAFQKEKHLSVDGKVGKVTWHATWTAPLNG